VKNVAAIDLVLRLLCIELPQFCKEPLDLVLDIAGQVFLAEHRGGRVSDCKDRNDIEIAAAGLKVPRAALT
jgi:hypothetical protein